MLPLNLWGSCPELAGDYICTDQERTFLQIIRSVDLKDFKVFIYMDEDNGRLDYFVANGEERDFITEAEGYTIIGKIISTCENDKLISTMRGKIKGLDYEIEYNLETFKKGATLITNTKILVNSGYFSSNQAECNPVEK